MLKIVLVALLSCGALAQGAWADPVRLTGLRVVEEEDRARIEIELSQAVECAVQRVAGTARLQARLAGCAPVTGLTDRLVSGKHVRSVHIASRGTDTMVEIVLAAADLDFRYFTVRNAGRFVVDVLEPRGPRRESGPTGAGSTRVPIPLIDLENAPAGETAGNSTTEAATAAPAAGAAGASADARSLGAGNGTPGDGERSPQEASKASDKGGAKKDSAKKSKGAGGAKGKPASSARSQAEETAALIEKGRALIGAGEIDKGLAYLEVAAAGMKEPGEKRTLFLDAARMGKAHGLCAQATRFYARVLALAIGDSLSIEPRVGLAECLAESGQIDSALVVYAEALGVARPGVETSMVRRSRADRLLALDRTEDALEDLEVLAHEGRDDAERIYASYRLGAFFMSAGNAEEALLALESIPAAAPDGSDGPTAYFVEAALVRRADLLFREGEIEEARPLYQTVFESWPASANAEWAAFQMANVDRRAGRYADALAGYENVFSRWPEGRWAKLARWGAGEAAWLLDASGGKAPSVARASGERPE